MSVDKIKNINDWEVLTDTGWSDFGGVKKVTKGEEYVFEFSDGNHLSCTRYHKLRCVDQFKEAENISIGDKVQSESGVVTVEDIQINKGEKVFYDLINVENNSRYYTNGYLSHNCHFIDGMFDLWSAIEPSVDHGEKVIALSSPNGPSGWFYDISMDAEEEGSPWKKIKLPWYVHPDRQNPDGSPNYEWRKNKDRTLGKRKASQEYDAEFGVATDTYFDPEFIEYQESNFVSDPVEKDGKMWYWEKPQPNTQYLVCVDCAEGGGDRNAVEVFKIGTMEQVAEFMSDMNYMDFGFIPVKIAREYNDALLVIEQNSVGTAVTQRAVDLDYHNLYYRGANNDNITMGTNTAQVGWKTTQRTRPLAIQAFRGLFESEDGIVIRSSRLLMEIKNFVEKNGKAQARSGYTDDGVMATSILSYVYKSSKFDLEHYGDVNDMFSLLAVANGKTKDQYEEIETKTYDDIIKEKEIKNKKKFATRMTGGIDQEIAEKFNWL